VDRTSYAVALGSNRRHGRHGAPARVVAAAVRALGEAGLAVTARSSILTTTAFGGAGRSFANAAVILDTALAPGELLVLLKDVEARFGRRPGRRWGARVLDLDILLWSGGIHAAEAIVVPHPALSKREFVLGPLVEIAPGWRHPLSHRTVRQLRARLRRAKPVDHSGRRP